MKRYQSQFPQLGGGKLACTVSAAALMLGVSHAATIGLKFTVDYCGFPNYVNYVNAPAFGIPMKQWQNLSPMGTGYHSCSGFPFFDLLETIDTTTATDGLHPLPNGALNLEWFASSANWSGFMGYDSGLPPQPINSGPPQPEAQVYAGFLRDGVNFGPDSVGGDNNQPGYWVDIIGLKSLFTNTPFAVQLVAASDSMQYLTNAFIIDATAGTTQSVVYPNPQVYRDQGDTPWFRGIGGGLSTASGSLNTDHLKIIGNRAAHDPDKNFASTISAAIITDKPVITMVPRAVAAGPADTVVWSGYAVGVPPLSYQWRKNGVPIAGATRTTYSITNVSLANYGKYDLLVTNLYGTAAASAVLDGINAAFSTDIIPDTSTASVAHNGLNHRATWLASSGTRSGLMSFTAAATNQVTVPGTTGFDQPQGSIAFWMRSSGLQNPSGSPATLFDRRAGLGLNGGDGLVIAQNPDGSIKVQARKSALDFSSVRHVADNQWHHVVLTFDQFSADPTRLYIDGTVDYETNNFGWAWAVGQQIELGFSHDVYSGSWQAYNGLMDDVRFYTRELTAAEVLSVQSSGAIVDASTLALRLNFDSAPQPGLTLTWLLTDATLQSADNVNGPYTDVPEAISSYNVLTKPAKKFYRYVGHVPTTVITNPFFM
jgi:hypothetical protein